jgi:hypothetical protein
MYYVICIIYMCMYVYTHMYTHTYSWGGVKLSNQKTNWLGTVAHACNSSHSGDRDQEATGSRPP